MYELQRRPIVQASSNCMRHKKISRCCRSSYNESIARQSNFIGMFHQTHSVRQQMSYIRSSHRPISSH